ncbi:hypothetical protein ACJRO7_017571 [Eucalyptus globulus]|uniref:Ubiquitin-like domain-containing protein n=1 Tax=Eucalyptus globulus TaxID=34317 RepID=A0ABD3L1T9_EUCGL
MDVFFGPQEGSPFCIQIGFHDTVLEIKEKIEKHQGIPIYRQTFVFNDEALDNKLDVEGCNIIELHIGMLPSKMRLPIEVKVNDPVKRLRKVVQSLEDVPLKRVKPYAYATKFEDDRRTCDYEIQDNSSVDVHIKPLKFMVMVLLWKANLKVAPSLKFNLPLEGYFFIHKQSGMDEDKSFKWHSVKMGDTIEVFKGAISR